MRWWGACADYGREVRMPNYCPCCDQILGRGVSTDILRYMIHTNSHLVDHHGPTRTCDEMYQRRVLNKAREFIQSCMQLMMSGNAGRAILAGDWAARMLRRSPYLAHGL